MRRKDKEIKNNTEMYEIIRQAIFCNVAMCKNNHPYIVPMNFGFYDETIYLHSSNEGDKIDILKSNPQVCIGIVQDVKIKPNPDIVCKTGTNYNSVIIFGKAECLSGEKEKIKALKCIVEHYNQDIAQAKEKKKNFDKDALKKLTVLKVKIEKITGKQSV